MKSVDPDGTVPVPARSAHSFFGGSTRVNTPVFDGGTLRPGHRIAGPAVIEEPTTTIVVYPGMTAEVSSAMNYLLTTR